MEQLPTPVIAPLVLHGPDVLKVTGIPAEELSVGNVNVLP
jgi:hypothetical protein